MKRAAAAIAVLAAAALAAAGCGGSGKDISSVKSCLEDLDLQVEASPKDDEDVREGVFATSELGGDGAAEDFTFAMAAFVKDEGRIKEFEDKSREFAKSASADGKLEFESGTDGDYVWVAGGTKGGDSFGDARGCVKP